MLAVGQWGSGAVGQWKRDAYHGCEAEQFVILSESYESKNPPKRESDGCSGPTICVYLRYLRFVMFGGCWSARPCPPGLTSLRFNR